MSSLFLYTMIGIYVFCVMQSGLHYCYIFTSRLVGYEDSGKGMVCIIKQQPYRMMELLLYLLVSVFELACHHVDWNLIFCSTAQTHTAYAYIVYNLYYTAV